MISIEPILEHVIPFTLVLFRLAGVFVFAPLLSSFSLPFQAKALIAAALAAAVYPVLPPQWHIPPEPHLFDVLPLVLAETMIGVCIGLIASIPLMVMQMAGVLAGYQMGLGLARSYNPELDMEMDVVGQLLFYMGTGVFLAIGGIDAVFHAVVRSFEFMPAGGFSPEDTPLALYVSVVQAGTELAMRVAAPIVGATLLMMIAMGFIMKTMPQVNILSVGFPAKILVGLFTFVAGLAAIHHVLTEETLDVLRQLMQWIESLGG